MEPVIQLQNVSKCFRIAPHKRRTLQSTLISRRQGRTSEETTVWALQDISLNVEKGEAIGIIGPNGSGKSTLLKLLAGVLQPSEGVVSVREPSLALLELGAGFRPDLTGEENIQMYGALFGLSREETQKCLEDAIEFAELGDFIDMPVRSYSSGMRARLAMAAAVSLSAPIIIIDEVLAVGDATFQEKSLQRLADLRRANHTVVLVSHNMESIRLLSDRVIVLQEGRMAFQGESEEAIWYYLQRLREERARKAREKAAVEEREEGDGYTPVEIVGAETLDGEGRPKQVFECGETLLLQVRYRAHEPVEAPIFQVQLLTESARYRDAINVSATNTDRGNYKIEKVEGEGMFTVRYEALPLLTGQYAFRVAILPHVFSATPFDLRTGLAPFSVESRWSEGGGLVRIPHTWSEENSPE